MVQLKKVLHNFLPQKYSGSFNRRTTAQTFKLSIIGNVAIGALLLVVHLFSSPDLIEMDTLWWKFIHIVDGVIIGSILIDAICWLLLHYMDSLYIKRLSAVVFYLSSGFISPITVIAIFCLVFPNSLELFAISMVVVALTMLTIVGCHIGLVAYAIRKHDISLRDKYVDIPVNTISIVSLVSLFPVIVFKNQTNEIPLIVVLSIALGVFLGLMIFQYPRVLRYWRQPTKQKVSTPIPHKNGIARIKKIR